MTKDLLTCVLCARVQIYMLIVIQGTEYLEREWRKQAASEGPDGEVFYVWFWQTSSTKAIRQPPNLSDRPELAENDIFMHRHDGRLQMWVWVADDGREYRWKRVQVGYRRPSDGRVLTLTEVHKKPSWLEPQWYKKRRNQSQYYSLYIPHHVHVCVLDRL